MEGRWRRAAACGFESHGFRCKPTWGHGPTGRRWLRKPETRVRFPVAPLTVSTVPWSSGEDAWPTSRTTMLRMVPVVRSHPGPLPPRYANWKSGLARAPPRSGGRRWLPVRLRLWVRLGRQPEDHPRLERRMLRVRVPPGPLKKLHALVEQSGVLACLSSRRSRVQLPSRALATIAARYTNRKSDHDHRYAAVPEPW